MGKPQNSETTPLVISLTILFAGVGVILVPFVMKLDMMQWGFGLIFLGGFIALSGIISVLIFAVRYRKFLKLSSGQKVLVHWTHDAADFEKQVRKDFGDRRKGNLAKLGIMLFFIVTITGVMAYIGYTSGEGDSMPMFVGIMVAVGCFLAFVAFMAPVWDRRRAMRNARDTYISERSLYTRGTLHSWGTVASRLVGVSLEESGPEKKLVFSIDYAAYVGLPQYINHTVEVPIPTGEEPKAREVVERLQPEISGS